MNLPGIISIPIGILVILTPFLVLPSIILSIIFIIIGVRRRITKKGNSGKYFRLGILGFLAALGLGLLSIYFWGNGLPNG